MGMGVQYLFHTGEACCYVLVYF